MDGPSHTVSVKQSLIKHIGYQLCLYGKDCRCLHVFSGIEMYNDRSLLILNGMLPILAHTLNTF